MKNKSMTILFSVIVLLIIAFLGYFFVGRAKLPEKITWGISFSKSQAELLGLDWKETYLALLDDLKFKQIKIAAQWNLIETKEGEFDFEDLDWQIKEAEKREAGVLLVTGLKVIRWPECHVPGWAESLSWEEKEEKALVLTEEVVSRYKDSPAIKYWQAENEPFFPFGECPSVLPVSFVKKEVALIRSIDDRPVIISDSGEGSLWWLPASIADVVSPTLYRRIWVPQLGFFKFYLTFPHPAVSYYRRALLVEKLFGKKVILGELQAEPWCKGQLSDCSREEQSKTMNFELFKKNIEFAQKTGFDEIYLWGSEWWYWLKEKQNDPEIWNEVKKLVN